MKKGPLFLILFGVLIMFLGSPVFLYLSRLFNIKEPWVVPAIFLVVVIGICYLVIKSVTSTTKKQ